MTRFFHIVGFGVAWCCAAWVCAQPEPEQKAPNAPSNESRPAESAVPSESADSKDVVAAESGLVPPRLLTFVEAEYPELARAANVEAVVEVSLVVALDGSVQEVQVLNPVGQGFDEAAVEAVQQFVFEPAQNNGEPIPARIRYRYVFELNTEDEVQKQTGRIRGVVLADDEQAIAGVAITLSAADLELVRNAVTAEDGTFYFESLPEGVYQVQVDSPEFGQRSAEEEVVAGQITEVLYRLSSAKEEAILGFGATAVIDPPPREVTRRTIRKDELTRIPGTRGDALRAVEILPGVARPQFGAGTLVVRGAAPGDSEVFLEGVSVPLLYHFGGLTSFINSRLLEQIDFYPGNYSARFGRRTGGILEVSTRDPARDRFHGVIETSLIDASLLLEGPITDKLSIAVGFRRSLIDLVFGAVVPDNVSVTAAPVYYDYQTFLTWRPTDRDRVRLLIYGSSDRFKLFFDEAAGDDPAVRGKARFLARFHYHHLSWERRINNRIEQDIDVMAGPIKLDFGFGDAFTFRGSFQQVYGRSEWRFSLSDKAKLIVGTDLFLIPADLVFVGPPARQAEGGNVNNDPIAGQDTVTVDEKTVVFRPGLYLETNLDLGPARLILATRMDYFSEIKRWVFDPRLSAIFDVNDQWRIKSGIGLYSQPPEFQESDDTIGNPNLKAIRSVHAGLGVEYDPTPGVSLGVEGFYKYLWDRAVSTPNGVPPYFDNQGIGRIYGLELSARLAPEGKRYFGYLSYTLSRSERRDRPGDAWRLFDFDQTHILTAAFSYRFKRNWELGGTFRVVSGNPTTPVVGSYYDGLNDVYFPIYGATNSQRIPLFHRLDVRVEKQWHFEKWKLAFFIDIQNAYNRQNQEDLVFNFDYTESTQLNGLPIIPAIGLRGEL